MSSRRLVLWMVMGVWVGVCPMQAQTRNAAEHAMFASSGGEFSIAVTLPAAGPSRIGVGLSESLLVTVSPANGFSQPVALTCANLPQEAACTFGLSTIPPGGGATTMFFLTSAPRDCGAKEPYFYGTSARLKYLLPVAVPAMAGLVLWPVRRRRLLLLGSVALAALSLSGCGRCTDLGTPPGTYTFNLTGSADQMVTVPITVTVSD